MEVITNNLKISVFIRRGEISYFFVFAIHYRQNNTLPNKKQKQNKTNTKTKQKKKRKTQQNKHTDSYSLCELYFELFNI